MWPLARQAGFRDIAIAPETTVVPDGEGRQSLTIGYQHCGSPDVAVGDHALPIFFSIQSIF